MTTSRASGQWEGGLKGGKGSMKPASADGIEFTFGSRFEGQPRSNPEELLGAALAGCFSMALSAALEKAGLAPSRVSTTAGVKLEKQEAGFTITAIELKTEAVVPGADAAKFHAIAQETKKTCPVSRALAAVPSITLDATLASA